MDGRPLILVGAYGSGKTEVAVNLALAWAREGLRVRLADLDLVNPYFRSREARRLLEAEGVQVVVPPGALAQADLPIVLPEIRGLLAPTGPGTATILDVGGEDAGARVLASFRPLLAEGAYELWQVLNAHRPFNATVAGCLETLEAIQEASRLRMTGLVDNSHLLEATTPALRLAGARLALEAAAASGLPLRCVTARGALADASGLAALGVPVLRLERHMLPPWPEANGHGADPD